MDKYEALRQAGTSAPNYDFDTDDVIRQLEAWDAAYGITLSNIGSDRLDVSFDRIPDDPMELAQEIYAFCPDTVDQGFGCAAEMIEMAEEMGEPVSPDLLKFVEGVDLEGEDYGVELMARSLAQDKRASLWWD